MAYIGSKPANKPVLASDLDPTIITGQTALAAAPASTDEFLLSDAGVLKRIDSSLIGKGKILQVQTKILTTTTQQTSASTTTLITSDDFTLSSTDNYVLAVLAFNFDLQGYSATTTPTAFLTLTDTDGTIKAKQQVKDRIAVNSEGHDGSGCMIAYFQEGSVSSRKVYVKYGSDGSGQLRIYGNSSFTNATRLMILEIAA